MPESSETTYDPEHGSETYIVNQSGIDDKVIMSALQEQAPEIAALTRWTNDIRARQGGIFQRDRYVNPKGIFGEIRVAKEAAEHDDVVSNVLETTEQLAFNRVVIECEDMDEEMVWAQIMEDLQIETRMREMWRELFISSFCYPAVWFGKPEDGGYRIPGKTARGNKRKKIYDGLTVPLGMSLLDPLRVVPVGNFMFGQEQLAYIATQSEAQVINSTLAGENSSDLIVKRLIKGRYNATTEEMLLLKQVTLGFSGYTSGMVSTFGPDYSNLYLLDPDAVFRVELTRPSYERFPAVRMKSIFELLDLKAQLREMDRAYIVGATNFIILVKKGSDERPAQQRELDQLTAQVRSAARVPLIVGDHRLNIEIVTPKNDKTLSPERYNSLDSRITARLYQLFNTGNYAAGTATDDSIKLIRVVARSMESRRNMIRDAVMKNVIRPVFEMNDALKSPPKLKFYPQRISLDFDPNIAVYLQDLRDRGDISRYTTLAELDIDEADEAMKRQREAELYDDIFTPVNVPFSSPQVPPAQDQPQDQPEDQVDEQPPANTKGAGRRGGGRTGGGGANRQSLKTNPPRGAQKPDGQKKGEPNSKS